MNQKLLTAIASWPAIAGLALLGVAPVAAAPHARVQAPTTSTGASRERMHPDLIVPPPSVTAPSRERMQPQVIVPPPSVTAPSRERLQPDSTGATAAKPPH